MKIALVRHGQTENNYLNICQGVTNVLLNDTGRRECQRLRDKIKDKKYDICYTSPLVRAVETAMILIGDRVRMIPDKRLIDRNLGELEGKNRELYDAKKYWDYDLNCTDLGVEGVQSVFERCKQFLDEILENNKGQSVLIVAHSSTIMALRHLILKSDLHSNLHQRIENCYFEEFEVSDK